MPLFARNPSASLRPELAMCFYLDESSQSGHRFLVLSVLAIFRNQVPGILQALEDVRRRHNQTRELGWSCVSKYKFAVYEGWMDVLQAFAAQRRLRVTSLILDTSERNDKQYNEGDCDLGFNKLLYQLLLHRVGKRYGRDRALFGVLDDRTTKHRPEKLRDMLNAGLAKTCSIETRPFKTLEFQNSKDSDLIQLTDIVAGGLAFHRNDHANLPGVRAEKILLSRRIQSLRRMRVVGGQFDIWEFHYKKRLKSLGSLKPPLVRGAPQQKG